MFMLIAALALAAPSPRPVCGEAVPHQGWKPIAILDDAHATVVWKAQHAPMGGCYLADGGQEGDTARVMICNFNHKPLVSLADYFVATYGVPDFARPNMGWYDWTLVETATDLREDVVIDYARNRFIQVCSTEDFVMDTVDSLQAYLQH